jgi:hypothetical protein
VQPELPEEIETPEKLCRHNHDVNSDGHVNVLDVMNFAQELGAENVEF